jgi:cyanophycin synthetase
MNLIEPIHRHAQIRPEDPAIIIPQGNISWSQLDSLVWTTALTLAENGLTVGDRVGISMTQPVLHLVTALALARIGVAHIAIPASDSDLARSELVSELELKRILADSEKIATPGSKALLINKLYIADVNRDQKQRLGSRNGELTWLILQSSGTTGAPKFAELSHSKGHDRFTRFLPLFNCNEADIFWAASRPDFVVAKQRLTFSLMAGAAVCIPTANTISTELLQFLNQHKVTLACGAPSHLHQLLATGVPIPSLRAFEARSAFISERLRSDFKSKINRNLYIVYGTNEGEALALADPTLQARIPNTVGVATTSIEIEVVDDNDVQLPTLTTGEVRARGPGVVTSYFKNPAASAKSFKDGWFYPGDLGYLTTEGALVLQGRKDDMMIFDGINIYPAEIENVLSSHPAIQEVAAFAAKHERLQDIPVAAVTLKGSVSENDLIEYCLAPLGIKHPKRIFILKEFPRNKMGKILKRELFAAVLNQQNPDSTH